MNRTWAGWAWFADATAVPLSSLDNPVIPFIDQDILVVLEELRPNIEQVCVFDL